MPARARFALAACLLFLGLASPAAAAEWTWAGPDGGEVLSLALQPSSSTVLYAGGEAGLFKSVDGGASWQLLAEGPAAPVIAIGIDPANTSTVYAGLRRQGLLKSTDGGAHWTDAGQGLPDLPPFGLSVRALEARGGAVYAGTDLGVYRSVDGGASWQALNEGLPPSPVVLSLEIDPSESETIYAGTDRYGLFRSTDGGAHWTPSPANGFALGTVHDVEVSPVSSAIVYAGSPYGVSRSADAGASWTLSQEPGLVNALAVHPTLAGTVYAGATNGVFKSTDGGATWVKTSEGLTDPRVLALAIDPAAPGKLWAGTNHDFRLGGVFQTTDGAAHWTWRSRGLSGGDVVSLAFDSHTPGTLFAALGYQGLARSRDQGRTWTALPVPEGGIMAVEVDPVTPSVVYAATTGSGPLLKSTDGGDTWNRFGPLTSPFFLQELEIDRANPNVFYGGAEGFYKSTDHGATWVQTSSFLSSSFWEIYPLQIEIAPSSPATLYSVTQEVVIASPPYPRNLLFRSRDAGQTWEVLHPPHEPARLAISPSDANTVYIATLEDGIFRTKNGGDTWEPVGSQLPRAATVAIAPGEPETLYTAVSAQGVFASTDGGASWTPVGEGLEGVSFTGFLALDPHEPRRLWTGVGKRGLATLVAAQDVCEPGPTTLCLRGGRFRVEAAWKDFEGNAGAGHAVPLTGETGALWFFQENNLELVVKVLDGRGLNGRFWVFVASLTSVEFTLTVTDTETGRRKVYSNPSGHMASFGDTGTF